MKKSTDASELTDKKRKQRDVAVERIDDEYALEVVKNQVLKKGKTIMDLRAEIAGDSYINPHYEDVMPFIPYDHLEDVLEIYELKVMDLFSADAKQNIVISLADQEFINKCSKLDDRVIDKLILTVKKLFEEKYKDERFRQAAYRAIDTPTGKAFCILDQRVSMFAKRDSTIPVSLQKAQRSALRTSIKFDEFPVIAHRLQISLHWLMGLTERTPFYSTNPKIDCLFDIYKVLTDAEKVMVEIAVDDLVENGEVTENG